MEFMPGSVVFSLIVYESANANGQLKKGDKGTVIGPAIDDRSGLLCGFPNLSRRLNKKIKKICKI